MAEQEACTELVEKASQDRPSGTIDGESLLLPLLQGLLDTPEKDQICDSGTESGEDQRHGLIAEVQNALDKLSASLITGATDITPERRSSLLELVNKLQAGLSSTAPNLERQLSAGSARFNKRRNRRSRHTVGVSSEELANARRLMEEISCREPSSALLLQKQNSESSVSSTSPFNKYGGKTVIKNATPKPFNNNSSNVSSSVQTPTDPSDSFFTEEVETTPDKVASDNEEDADTVINALANDESEVVFASLQVNPIYTKPKETITFNLPDTQKIDRFNTRSKKLRMKRANTIDIPKPLNFYEDEDDSDNSESETDAQKRKNEYYALRGPIRVGNPANKQNVPIFEPKTHSDQKFLALIGKNSDKSDEERKTWSGQNNTTVWNSKFGNIRKNFERPTVKGNSAMNFWKTQDDTVSLSNGKQYGPTISKKSARNLQQMFEEKQRQSQLQTFNMSENKASGSTVSRPIPVKKFVPQPLPVNQFSHAPQSAFRPISKKPEVDPEPVKIKPNNAILKQEIKEDKDKTSLFLYSPKPLSSYRTSEATSPVNLKPWVTNSTDHGGRVLNMVANKFEATQQHESVVRPRRVSKEFSDVFYPQQLQPEKMTAPYVTRSTPSSNSFIRKLSKEYDTKVENIANTITPVYKKPSNQFRNSLHLNPGAAVTNQTQYHYHKPSFDQQPKTSGDKYKISQEIKTIQPVVRTTNQAQPLQIYQHVPGKETHNHELENVYTSTLKFTPLEPTRTTEPVIPPPKLQTQMSNESLHEYTAISSRVMSGPVSQQAVTVQQKKPMSRNEHDMRAAFDLKNVLQNVSRSDQAKDKPEPEEKVFAEKLASFERKQCLREETKPLGFQKTCGIVKPMQQKPTAIYNNINRRESDRVPSINVAGFRPQAQLSTLSKSDSWHQICLANQASPELAQAPKNVMRSKSSHSLAVPQKQFEAGLTREELSRKKLTVEAYFSGSKSPENVDASVGKSSKRSINRVKTSEKVSTQQRSSNNLARSRTLPDMVSPQLLDETNVDKAFEDLFMSIS